MNVEPLLYKLNYFKGMAYSGCRGRSSIISLGSDMLRTPHDPCKVHTCSKIMMRERCIQTGLVTVMALPIELFEERPLQHDDARPLRPYILGFLRDCKGSRYTTSFQTVICHYLWAYTCT